MSIEPSMPLRELTMALRSRELSVVEHVTDVLDRLAADTHNAVIALDADAALTALHDVAALVLTADCMPIALATPSKVAMVHAGWRGLADGVIENAIEALGTDEPIVAAIGPSAGCCCYEVGDDVREALCVDPRGEPALIDLKAIACERLYDADVDVVHDVGLCTMCTPPGLFFSHRRDGPVTGRQGGMAWRPSS